MRALTVVSAVAAVLALLSFGGSTANAQTQAPAAATIHKQAQNFTPVEKAACNRGWIGEHGCGPGWMWSNYWKRCIRCY